MNFRQESILVFLILQLQNTRIMYTAMWNTSSSSRNTQMEENLIFLYLLKIVHGQAILMLTYYY